MQNNNKADDLALCLYIVGRCVIASSKSKYYLYQLVYSFTSVKMDFNFTSKEYNKTFHLMENVSLDEHSMNVNSPVPSAVMMTFYVFLYVIVEL